MRARHRIATLMAMRTLPLYLLLLLLACDTANAAEPETIYGVAHVRKGAAEQFRLVERESWDVYLRLGLVRPDLHVVLQGVEDVDKPFFLVVFTWKSADIPEHAPQEVLDVWAKMRALCEKRSGHPPMEISEMRLIEPRN